MRASRWATLLVLLLAGGHLLGASLPASFSLARVAEGWKDHPGLVAQVALHTYQFGQRVGEPISGRLYLMAGKSRLDLGGSIERIYDGAQVFTRAGSSLTPGGGPSLPPLPEGLLLQSSRGLTDVATAWGVDLERASPGRMPTEGEVLPFLVVTRYGLPPGPDAPAVPQLWVDTHLWRLRAAQARVDAGVVRVDYLGYGKLEGAPSWLPTTLRLSREGSPQWELTVTAVASERPTAASFDPSLLGASGR